MGKETYYDGGLDEDAPVWVGLDQSWTGFGLVLFDGERWDGVRYEIKERGGAGLEEIHNWLYDTLKDEPIQGVALEGYAPGRTFGREMAGELCGMVLYTLHRLNLEPPLRPAPSQVKKFACGAGAEKSDMKLAVYKRWGVDCSDDDVVDAYVLARIAYHRSQRDGLIKAQEEVLDALLAPKTKKRKAKA